VSFQRFFEADVCFPVRAEYLHTIVVPEFLDQFCQELETYQDRSIGDCFMFTLAIAHLSLESFDLLANPYSTNGRYIIRDVLIRLTIFYHLLYRNADMWKWSGWETRPMGNQFRVRERYLFVWMKARQYHESADVIQQLIQQYTDRHVWCEWLEPRIEMINEDVSVEIVPARTKYLNQSSD
jgi:hypothetical protein